MKYFPLHITLGFILLISSNITAFGQTPYYRNLSAKDGLPSNKVYCATQDASGFIWFGTDNGLVRYDGTHMKTYTVREGLPDNDVFTVFEDQQQRLWVLTFKQAPCYFYHNKLYTAANDSFLAKNFSNPNMFRFSVNHFLKRILFTVYINGQPKVLEYDKEYRLPQKLIAAFSLDEPFQIYQQNRNDFLIYKKWALNTNTGNLQYLFQESIYLSEEFHKQGKDIGIGVNSFTNKTVYFHANADSIQIIKIEDASGVSRIFANQNSDVYLVHNDGILEKVDLNNLTHGKISQQIPNGLVSTIFIDKYNSLWVCTQNTGIYYFAGNGAVELETNQDFGANCITYSPLSKSIYVGFENMALHAFGAENRHKRIDLNTFHAKNPRITSIAVSENYIAAGGDFGLLILDEISNRTRTVESQLIATNSVKDIEITMDGELLVGSALGAAIYDHKTAKQLLPIWFKRTTAVCEDQSHNFWIGTINGIQIYKRGATEVVPYRSNTPLDNSRITDIKTDKDGKIWIGTAQWGLFILDNNKILHISDDTKDCNLTSYYIKNIFIDNKGTGWISTDKGLNRISLNNNKGCRIDRITKSMGIPDNNINACWVMNDTIFLASQNGISKFIYAPGLFSEIPGLEITGLKVNFREAQVDSIYLSELKSNENNLSIEFSAIAFRSSDNIVYRYRLIGSEEGWIKTNSNRIDLLSLKPGKYTFEIQAINILTNEMSPVRSFSFNIHKPWYSTWQFIALMVFMISGFIFWFSLLKSRRIKREAEEENTRNKQMAELEMQALRSQMNPHFIFNALSAIQNYFVLNKEEAANAYMTKFSRLIRQMLNYSKNNFILLNEEIELLNNYLELEKMRFENKMTYEITVQKDIQEHEYRMPSLLLQPLLENAVNHGIRPAKNKGLISLAFSKNDTRFICKITDNGIGLNASRKSKDGAIVAHISKGISILESRIQSLNTMYNTHIEIQFRDLSDENPETSGTEVTILFPLPFVSEKEETHL